MKSALAVLLSLGLLSVVYGGGMTALMMHAHGVATVATD
jgi:hypothetical protein